MLYLVGAVAWAKYIVGYIAHLPPIQHLIGTSILAGGLYLLCRYGYIDLPHEWKVWLGWIQDKIEKAPEEVAGALRDLAAKIPAIGPMIAQAMQKMQVMFSDLRQWLDSKGPAAKLALAVLIAVLILRR